MPYLCSKCKETFQHTAKLIENGLPDGKVNVIAAGFVEYSICPLCHSKAYTEIIEEKQGGGINLADVESLIDCPPNEADIHLKDGYVLFQTWQKNCFLVKLKAKQPPKAAEASQA